SLRLPGDSHALPATVLLNEGRLQVASGEHVIGDWPIETIDISAVPEGIRVAAEGEVLLLDISDRAAFEQEAASLNGKPKRFSRQKTAKPEKTQSAKAVRTEATATKTAAVKTPKPKGNSRLDGYLARAKERFGAKLPDWVFSRIGLAAAVLLLVLCVIFAELVSNLLLIAGVVILLVGGVTMLDSVIARQLLHHKVTPIQVVIGGGTIFVTGLLVGIVA
ncbi:MAG: hypothetical protein ACRDX9_16790, partial [Acidimicrobiia bacterium]